MSFFNCPIAGDDPVVIPIQVALDLHAFRPDETARVVAGYVFFFQLSCVILYRLQSAKFRLRSLHGALPPANLPMRPDRVDVEIFGVPQTPEPGPYVGAALHHPARPVEAGLE